VVGGKTKSVNARGQSRRKCQQHDATIREKMPEKKSPVGWHGKSRWSTSSNAQRGEPRKLQNEGPPGGGNNRIGEWGENATSTTEKVNSGLPLCVRRGTTTTKKAVLLVKGSEATEESIRPGNQGVRPYVSPRKKKKKKKKETVEKN